MSLSRYASQAEMEAKRAQRAKIRKDPRFAQAMEFIRAYGNFGNDLVRARWARECSRDLK